MAGPKHVWIIPPQALTTELSSFGVRTVDVVADEDLFVPGYEYHYFDEDADESEHFSQIPEGFAGELSEHDNDRADASAWLDPIPIIRDFRRKVLGQRRKPMFRQPTEQALPTGQAGKAHRRPARRQPPPRRRCHR